MAENDQSQYILRFNEISTTLEFKAGNLWTTIDLGVNPDGIVTGEVRSDGNLNLVADPGHVNITATGDVNLTPDGDITLTPDNAVIVSNLLSLEPVSEAQRDALTPIEGSICMNGDTHMLNVYDGADWQEVAWS